ncbi:MAG: PEP-CTERM sorting domain-containing protein [Verrucomicrobiota bacterium]
MYSVFSPIRIAVVATTAAVCIATTASAQVTVYEQDFSTNDGATLTPAGNFVNIAIGSAGGSGTFQNNYSAFNGGGLGLTITEDVGGFLSIVGTADGSLNGSEATSFTGPNGGIPLNGLISGSNLADFTLSFDYSASNGVAVGLRPRLSAGSFSASLVGPTQLSATSSVQTFSASLDTWTDQGTFVTTIDDGSPDTFSIRLGSAQGNTIGGGWIIDNIRITQVPEPSTYALIGGLVVLGVGFIYRRRQR